MRALWLVALLLAPCATAEGDAETTLTFQCIETNEADGGNLPQAHAGSDTYVYIPVAPLSMLSGAQSSDGIDDSAGTRGTEIRYSSGCLDLGELEFTLSAPASSPRTGVSVAF
jgi:hypothetical protein